jgi:hypothetical protein
LAAFLGLPEAAFEVFCDFALPAALVIDIAFRSTAFAPERTTRPAVFTTSSVSLGASNRATPAAATAPRTTLVIPIFRSRCLVPVESQQASFVPATPLVGGGISISSNYVEERQRDDRDYRHAEEPQDSAFDQHDFISI